MAAVFTTWIRNLCLISCLSFFASARPERGKWQSTVDKDNEVQWFVKSLYAGGQISVSVTCNSPKDQLLDITWVLRRSPCAQEYMGLNRTYVLSYLNHPSYLSTAYKETEFMKKTIEKVKCTKDRQFFFHPINVTKEHGPTVARNIGVKSMPPTDVSKAANRRRRAAGEDKPKVQSIDDQTPESEMSTETMVPAEEQAAAAPPKPKENVIDIDNDFSGEEFLQVWSDGYYVLILRFSESGKADESTGGGYLPDDFSAEVEVRMMWDQNNYISAGDYPLLIFYGVMGLVYIGFGLIWLLLLACNWKDLLRVQFWVGGVIFLGMLEKAVFFAEYENINKDGQPVRGAIILAELVSCVKRGLARMLVIIVCLGFGIIKPRLGQTLHKVLLAGIVFIVLASIEGCMRATKERPDQSTEWMFAAVPLAVTDAIICWWVFSALLQTTRTLRLRRNVVKLSLYRHFTNTLIFAIIASIAYMIWFLTQHRFKNCITDWKELWVDEAFWHLLFSVILLIIMILWRPSENNQRYAFSPLLDAAEDDMDDDQQLGEAYEGMKMRSTNAESRKGPRSGPDAEQKVEDDLKWVEENIPSSLADKLLPALDSDEEIMNQKFEVSKME